MQVFLAPAFELTHSTINNQNQYQAEVCLFDVCKLNIVQDGLTSIRKLCEGEADHSVIAGKANF